MQPSPLKHYWLVILVTTMVTFLASVALTVSQPMEYRTRFTVLVLEKNQNLDGYAAAKAAERLSQSLGQAITTAAFADSVYNQIKDNPALQGNPLLSADAEVRQAAWRKEVTTAVRADVGQVTVSIYQKDRAQAALLGTAVSIATVGLGGEYLSSGNSTVLKIVDYPLTSKAPERPNIFLNLAAGALVGLAGSMVIILLFASRPIPPSYGGPIVAPVTPPLLSPVRPMTQMTPMTATQSEVSHRLHIPPTPPTSTPTPQSPLPPAPSTPTEPSPSTPTNLPVADEWVMP